MAFIFSEAWNLKRSSRFPLTVSGLYSCGRRRFLKPEQQVTYDKYEITLRLDSDSRICRDEINGKVMEIPFPNVVFKSPGMKIKLADDTPREAIGFSYSRNGIEILKRWDMLPEPEFLPLQLTAELQRLIGEFHKFTWAFPTLNFPGDRIDGICFDILREILLNSRGGALKDRTPEVRIKEAELFLKHHFDEKLNLDEVARRFGFSHASFYQYWKKFFAASPHHYLEELKLRTAAFQLLQSGLPLSVIIKDVRFPGAAAFHRKFKERFHVTPGEFRRNREHWMKEFPEFGG